MLLGVLGWLMSMIQRGKVSNEEEFKKTKSGRSSFSVPPLQ
jgi:hypothetical protein